MDDRRRLSLACGALCGLSLLLPGMAGCAMLNSFLDPTTVGQVPAQYKERGIRRILTPRDSPPGPPNASEPTPEDLVPIFADYRLGPGDVLMVMGAGDVWRLAPPLLAELGGQVEAPPPSKPAAPREGDTASGI